MKITKVSNSENYIPSLINRQFWQIINFYNTFIFADLSCRQEDDHSMIEEVATEKVTIEEVAIEKDPLTFSNSNKQPNNVCNN